MILFFFATHTVLGVSSRPVNALTLDEIHARENIETSPIVPITKSGGEDLGAFNKLVAGLQSSGALNKDNTEQPVQHKVLYAHVCRVRNKCQSFLGLFCALATHNLSIDV